MAQVFLPALGVLGVLGVPDIDGGGLIVRSIDKDEIESLDVFKLDKIELLNVSSLKSSESGSTPKFFIKK